MKMSPVVYRSSLLLLIAALSACADNSNSRKSETGSTVSIMTYNVENLFDTKQDANREDYTYLPKATKDADLTLQENCKSITNEFYRNECLNLDWNQSVLDKKLSNLAETILQVNGRGPDILILPEVENILVLRELNDRFLKAAGYQTVELIEGEDERGIDIGILSRFPQTEPARINLIDFVPDPANPDWKRPGSRGIMEINVKLPSGENLTVYGLHFPSQSNPRKERIDAINTLNKLMLSKGPNALVIAAGDFNINGADEKEDGLYSKHLAGTWGAVAHLVGCAQCGGTYNYRGAWEFLDSILFSPGLAKTSSAQYQLNTKSIRLVKDGIHQMGQDGKPKRYDIKTGEGASDHLALYAEITTSKK